MLLRAAVIFAFALPGYVLAQDVTPPADSALVGIIARGRMLAEYDRAAWHASDAMLARWRNPSGLEGYLAIRNALGRWTVLFGRLSAASDSLLILATAEQQDTPERFAVTLHSPPRLGPDDARRAFVALRTVGEDLGANPRPHQGPYNSYVLPRPDGGWWVYFLPAQTRPNEYPHGGDFRYEVSADGRTIEAKVQMHNTVLVSQVPADAASGWHTVVTADLPQDSDVFLVLTRKPAKPEMVVTEHFQYEIRVDGSITWQRAPRR
ncbi:MAG TPA: hypothetical protein VF178_07935 [Gemmatimonadaceae bacterium]